MDYIQFEKRDRVGIVTFSNPERMNALSMDAISQAAKFFSDLTGAVDGGTAGDLRALLLTGAGKAFISGADVKQMSVMGPEEAERFSAEGNALMRLIERFPVPVVAAVNGYALGGGFELALCADFIYASAAAKLGLPEVTLGIFPGFGGSARLAARVGASRASELLYTGRLIGAEEALRIGIVNQVFEPAGLLEAALQTAALMAKAGPHALKEAKKNLRECARLDAEAAAAVESRRFGLLFAEEEAREGLEAFLAKRPPTWGGGTT
jgi:enoyl-CoA hydratase